MSTEEIKLLDGAKITYLKRFISIDDSDKLFYELLKNVNWETHTYIVYDKEVESPRLMDVINFDEFPENLPLLKIMKNKLEKQTEQKFNYAVLNYYRSGDDYISPHSDKECEPNTNIISLSLGAKRKFVLKHKTKNSKYEFLLNKGDVLIMNEAAIKTHYKHSVPKMAGARARISITFRE